MFVYCAVIQLQEDCCCKHISCSLSARQSVSVLENYIHIYTPTGVVNLREKWGDPPRNTTFLTSCAPYEIESSSVCGTYYLVSNSCTTVFEWVDIMHMYKESTFVNVYKLCPSQPTVWCRSVRCWGICWNLVPVLGVTLLTFLGPGKESGTPYG